MSARTLDKDPPPPRAADPVASGDAEAAADGRPWRWAATALALGSVAVLALYWNTAWSMGSTWWDSPAFSHGFLIVPISAYLIWQQRARLAALRPRPSLLGPGVAALGALSWLVGHTAGVVLIQQVALVLVLQGLFLAVLGPAVTAVIAFPLLYLFFGVPFGTFLIQPLQDLTAAFVVRFLQMIGMPVYLDGVFIFIPSGSFEVAEACAGLRFLITSVALGVIFAHEFYRRLWRRALFMALAIIVPVIANGFRATGLVLLAHYSDYKLAVGVDHVTYGLIFLSLVLFCLIGIGYTFREPYLRPRVDPKPARPGAAAALPRHLLGSSLGVAAIVAASWAYSVHVESRSAAASVVLSAPAIESWQPAPPAHADWKPKFPNASRELVQGFSDGSAHVDLYVAYFAQQNQGAEIVNWLNSLAGQSPWQRAGSGAGEMTIGGDQFAFKYDRIVADKRGRMVRYWYWVDNRLTASPYVAKILEVRAKLFGRERAAAVIAVAADYTDNPRAAQQALDRFLTQAWPLDQVFTRPEG